MSLTTPEIASRADPAVTDLSGGIRKAAGRALLSTAAEPLFAFARRGIPEVVIHGANFCAVNGNVVEGSDPAIILVARSLLKPWQFLASDASGDESWWALGLSSHSAQPHQLEGLRRLCEAAGAGEDDLICPRTYPFDWAIAAKLKLEGLKPSRLHHPCSGKHLLMLAACRKHGYPLENYWDPEHPMQKRVYGVVGRETHQKPIWVTGPCGVPTIALPAGGMIGMWDRLVHKDDEKSQKLIDLYIRNPRAIGGHRRLDSDLVEVTEGRVLAKEGGDGLLIIQSLPIDGEPTGTVMIKVASGYHTAYVALALWAMLSQSKNLPKIFGVIREYLRSRLEEWIPRDQTLVLPPFNLL